MPTTYSQGATAAASAVGLALPGTGLFGSQTSDTTPGIRGQDSDPGGTGPFLIAMSFTAQANGMVNLIRANLAMANQVAGEFIRIGVATGAYAAAAAIPAFGSITWANDLGGNPAYVDVPVQNVSNGNLSQLTDALIGGMRLFNGSAYTVLIVCVNAAKNGYGGSRFFMGSGAGVYNGGIPSSAVWLANSPSNNWAAAAAGEVYIYGAMHFASQFIFVPCNQFTYAFGATAANMHVDLHLIHSIRNATLYTYVPPNQFNYSVGTTSSPVGTYNPHTSLNAWTYNKAGPFAWVAQHTSPCIRRRLPAGRYGKFAMVAVTQAATPNPPWVPPMTGPAYGT